MSFALEICGCVGGQPLYRMQIKIDAWHRLVALTREGVEGLPDWLDLGTSAYVGQKAIATTDPSYFDPTLKEERPTYVDENASRNKAGFSEL